VLLFFTAATTACASETYLPSQLKWVNFELVMGRLSIGSVRYGSNKTRTLLNEKTGVRQVFSIGVDPRGTTLRFELSRPESQLTVKVHQRGSAVITLVPIEDAAAITPVQAVRVQLDQPAKGDMKLCIGSGAGAREYKAKSFWHLAVSHPEIVARHLAPLLETLRPGWDLNLAVKDLEHAVISAPATHRVDRRRAHTLVKNLALRSFRTRQEAYRELLDMGQGVLTYFDQLDTSALNREQRARISAIRRLLVVKTGDTPARVARWVYDDQHVWLALMQRSE